MPINFLVLRTGGGGRGLLEGGGVAVPILLLWAWGFFFQKLGQSPSTVRPPRSNRWCFPNGVFQTPGLEWRRWQSQNTQFASFFVPFALVDPEHPLSRHHTEFVTEKHRLENTVCYSLGPVLSRASTKSATEPHSDNLLNRTRNPLNRTGTNRFPLDSKV